MIPLSPPLSSNTCHPLSTALSLCTTIPKRKFIKREERAHLKYMGNCYAPYKEHKTISLRYVVACSSLSNVLQLRVFQIVHIMYLPRSPLRWIANCPFQQANKWTTLLCITHCTWNKNYTRDHNSLLISQSISKWSTESIFFARTSPNHNS